MLDETEYLLDVLACGSERERGMVVRDLLDNGALLKIAESALRIEEMHNAEEQRIA